MLSKDIIQTGICLFVRDEATDIREWIAFHILAGFTHFFIYDNGSVDDTVKQAKSMARYAEISIVDWGSYKTENAQRDAYSHCYKENSCKVEWILFIDCDEFLAGGIGAKIQDLINSYKDVAAFVFNWLFYGSNGHLFTPKDLVIQDFTRRSVSSFPANAHTKMMMRTNRDFKYVNPHYFQTEEVVKRPNGTIPVWTSPGITRDIFIDQWRVHHYFVKSRQQWMQKLTRGYRDARRRVEEFEYYDRNEINDLTASVRANDVRALL